MSWWKRLTTQWVIVVDMLGDRHVVPHNEVGHAINLARDCGCKPEIEEVKRRKGNVVLTVIRHRAVWEQ